MTSPILLASLNLGLVIPLAAFGMPVLIVFMYHYFTHQRRRLWHETARLALEKGQPVPPVEEDPMTPAPRAKQDVRSGLILVAVGSAIYLGLESMPLGKTKPPLMGALIPTFIGIALLLNALITALISRGSSSRQSPPQS